MQEVMNDDSFAVYSRIDKDVYKPYRDFLKENGYPVSGHFGKIYKLNNYLLTWAIEEFMNTTAKEKKDLMLDLMGEPFDPKCMKDHPDNLEYRAKYKREYRKNKKTLTKI